MLFRGKVPNAFHSFYASCIAEQFTVRVGWVGGRAGQLLHAALLELAYMASIVHRIGLSSLIVKEDRQNFVCREIQSPSALLDLFIVKLVKVKGEGLGGDEH